MKHILFCLLLLAALPLMAQHKIVVLGSSTAEGFGATPHFPYPPDSSWVNLLRLSFNKNPNDNADTLVINLAFGGYTTYQLMPDNFTPPSGRPVPDPDRNVSKALSHQPDAIIINLPSNDISVGYNKQEIMNNFRAMFLTIMGSGVNAFITTTHPRNFAPNYLMMQYQQDLKDSIMNNFGYFAINTWDVLVEDNPPYDLKPEVRYTDGYHLNNLGHRLLYQQVAAKDLFVSNIILPTKIKSFAAGREGKNVKLEWETLSEEQGTVFEIQKSKDGISFVQAANLPATSAIQYKWIDIQPFSPYSYYRLKIHDPGAAPAYSEIRKVRSDQSEFLIRNVIVNRNSIIVQADGAAGPVVYSVFSADGKEMAKGRAATMPANGLKIDIPGASAGLYWVALVCDQQKAVRSFILQ